MTTDDPKKPTKKVLNLLPFPDEDDESFSEAEAVFTKTIPLHTLGERQPKTTFVGTKRVLLVRIRDQIYATKNACPHAGAPMSAGTCRGTTITCPRHGWAFLLTTGECLTNPLFSLTLYPTKVEDGFVWVCVPQ